MSPNYYTILAVAESATQEEIKKAYRQAAMRCHPDRGGSHEQMLVINEAFGILGNPVSRREYDFARKNQADRGAQQAAERTTQTARSQAANYPREWGAFEKWLNSVAADFHRAEYGSDGKGITRCPTAGDSLSGKAFIVIGGAIGGIIGLFLFIGGAAHPFVVIIPSVVGAWIGRLLHGGAKRMIPPPSPPPLPAASQRPPPSSPPPFVEKKIVACPNCSQQLRVPVASQPIKVKCTICAHVFTPL